MFNASETNAPAFAGSRFGRAGLALAVLFTLGLLLAPSRSRAATEPFKIDFDQSQMKVGLLSDLPLGEVATTGSLEGTIDENGNVKVPKDKFVLPKLGITEPVSVKVFMGIESDATGTFDRQTGKLELNAQAGVWVSVNVAELMTALQGLGVDVSGQLGSLSGIVNGLGDLTCGFSPMDVTFSTENEGGSRFAKGPLGPGSITAEWSQLGPFAGKTKILVFDVCQLIKSYAPTLLEGALGSSLPEGLDLGGLDLASLLDNLDNVNLGPSSLTLSRSLDESVPDTTDPGATSPRLKVTVNPKQRKVKPGKKTEFTVKVKNSGDAAATKVKICLNGSGAKVVGGKRCRTLGKVMAGATQTRRYRVKVSKKRKRALKVKFVVKSSNASRAKVGAKLLIKRR